MKNYIVRSLKYLIAFAVLYVGMMWVMHNLNNPFNLTFEERWLMMFQDNWRGWSMIVGMILLAGTYPYFGYTKRSIEGNIVTDREQINRAADFTNLVLVAETENELIYHAKGVRRLAMLFEDEVRVRQNGGEIEISGLRRVAVRMAFDAERYITNKRRKLQMAYNEKYNITPQSTSRTLKDKKHTAKKTPSRDDLKGMPKDELKLLIKDLERDMKDAAARLDFERAADLRNKLYALKGMDK